MRRWDREMLASLVMSFKENNARAEAMRRQGSSSVKLNPLSHA